MSKKKRFLRKERKVKDKNRERGLNRASTGVHGRLKHLFSNFRLSLTFRIALHYCHQLLRTTLTALLVLTLVFGGTVLADLEESIRRLRYGEAGTDGIFSQEIIQEDAVSATLNSWPYSGDAVPGIAYRFRKVNLWPTHMYVDVEACHSSGQSIYMTYDLHDPFVTWCWLMLAAPLCDALRVISFMRLNKTVLAPIRDITDMAATLSASNLSNRINIAGMKNELKDLAVVINSMLDRIERSYNSQKQFVSDASHELRTPIAVIQGYINMLQRWGKSDPEVLDEGISAIAQETTSMKELVESLLFLARHDKKTLMMEVGQFDALELAQELHREAAMVTPDDTFRLSPADGCLMEGDRGMIKQVLRILCDNAVKYTPRGGIITIGVTCENGWCTFSVSDNGPGISADELPKIFDRFYRSDSARKSEGGGHGLGLSIARIIVMAHGGKLRVRSKVGQGSTFFMTLPQKQDKLHTAKLSTAEATAQSKKA